MKALIAYVSRTGRCRRIASELAAELGGGVKLEEIEDLGKHSGIIGWLRAGRDSFYCTMASSGGAKAFAGMAGLCGKEPVATEEFRDRDIRRGAHAEPPGAFAARIRDAIGGAD